MKYALIITMLSITVHAAQPLVYPGEDGKLVYTPHANTGETNKVNVIPDFSHCGYMGGGVKIPEVPVKVVVEHQPGDARKRIQSAIDEVSKLPLDKHGFRGAVLIKAGIHELTPGGIRIGKSGVVVRGEGQGLNGTLLRVKKRGMIRTFLTIAPSKRPKYEESTVSRIADDHVGTGAVRLTVMDGAGFAAGDLVRVYVTPNQTWLDDIQVNAYVGKNKWRTETYTIPYLRRIAQVSDNLITIDSPLVCPVQKRQGGGELRKVTLSEGEPLENIGLENMSIVGNAEGNDKGRIVDAISMRDIENAWISGVTVYHQADSMVSMSNTRYVTVQDCASLRPIGPKRGGYRYTYNVDKGSNHNLFQRCYAYDGRHDFVAGAFVAGPNVFLDCYSERGGTQGPHHRWSTGLLFDNIKTGFLAVTENRGGSGSGHGWTGAGNVGWNCRSGIVCNSPKGYQNYAIGCIGGEHPGGYVSNEKEGVYRGYYESHGKHVEPRSLYLRQLEERLGKQAVRNVTTEEQRTGKIIPYPLQVTIEGAYITDKPAVIAINSETKGARIHYTTDGSEPTLESTLYAGPLTINAPCTIKAFQVDKKNRPGRIAEYAVERANPAVAPGPVKPGLVRTLYDCRSKRHWSTFKDTKQLARSVVPQLVPPLTPQEEFDGEVYALAFSGYIDVPKDGAYTFETAAVNYYMDVFIDGSHVVQSKGKYSPRKGRGTIGLRAGWHKIDVHYFRWCGTPAFEISWSGPGFDKSPIPAAALFHSTEEAGPLMAYLPPPTIAPTRAIIFDKPASVTITTRYQGGQIRYTTDGTTPTADSPLYTGPLAIDKPCTIKAATFDVSSTRSGSEVAATAEHALKAIAPGPSKPGLLCRHYQDVNKKRFPDFKKLQPDAQIVLPTLALPEKLDDDKFALLYTGYLDVPTNGIYTFESANVFYFLDLFIDDARIVQSKGKYSPRSGTGTIGLFAGRHKLEVRYLDWGGDPSFELLWSGPGFAKSTIPASALTHSQP